MTEVLFVCVGSAIGAPGRYLVDRAVQARHDGVMPWGTLTVNVVGSLLLGLLTGLGVHRHVPAGISLIAGPGFCGALTTYSTFSFETLRLFEEGARLLAVVNVLVTLGTGLAAALLGHLLGAAL